MAKKKIKDFTIGEMLDICRSHRHCSNCPFAINNRCVPSNIFVKVEDLEIEVEENGRI